MTNNIVAAIRKAGGPLCALNAPEKYKTVAEAYPHIMWTEVVDGQELPISGRSPWSEEQVASALAAFSADEATSEARRSAIAAAAAKGDPTVRYLLTHDDTEITARVYESVTDLASAKVMMGRFALAIAFILRNDPNLSS